MGFGGGGYSLNAPHDAHAKRAALLRAGTTACATREKAAASSAPRAGGERERKHRAQSGAIARQASAAGTHCAFPRNCARS
jgi:hypothetical protein